MELRHPVEAAALAVFPRLDVLLDWPEKLLGHELAAALRRRQCARSVLRRKAVDAASARRGAVQIVAHRIDGIVRRTVVDAVALGILHPACRARKALHELLYALHVGRFVGADPMGDGSVVADALHLLCHAVEVEARIVGMARVARHPELLPDKKPVFIAELVEAVGLRDAARPEPHKVDAAFGREPHLGLHALVVLSQHSLWNPVRAAYEYLAAVHVELPRPILARLVGRELANAKADRLRVRYAAGNLILPVCDAVILLVGVEHELHVERVEVLRPLVARPP